ncbi:MAG TPA: DUF1684 domain-containing protein [Vicinamibacterales bacterium]|nr:DUF1684 domain-containing protein [Vicinamibacterales bacterium]
MLAAVRLVCLFSVLALAACTSGPGPVDEAPYLDSIRASRAEKDTMLRTDRDSPIPAGERATFPGLPYFDVSEEYRVPASLRELNAVSPVIIEMQETDGKTAKMRKVGSLAFSIKGAPYTLTAFAELDDRSMERLFVPFGDLTNGTETYKGGRFLNLTRTPTGLYDLDFNRAYHPYCVYNPSWICPVPPHENRLLVAIPAGEKLPAKAAGGL